MDHNEAVRMQAGSRYLAGDLPPQEVAAFEEHYFTCPICAEELEADAIFEANVKAVFHKRAEQPGRNGYMDAGWLAWTNRFNIPLAVAFCGLLLLTIYQNGYLLPGLRSQIAFLRSARSIPWVPLKIAREDRAYVLPKNVPFWLAYFRLANPDQFPSYVCEIAKAGGSTQQSVTVPAPAPGQPISILLNRSEFSDGSYLFKVRGQNSSQTIVSYTISITSN